jgi:hypothetical protein
LPAIPNAVPNTGRDHVRGPDLACKDGSRAGWWKIKDRSWYEREAWRFDRR